MKINLKKLKKSKGYQQGADVLDPESITLARDYKRRVAGAYAPIAPEWIESKVGGKEIVATRKIDGEMQVLCFDGEDAVIINGGGTTRAGLPCVAAAVKALKAAGLKSAMIAAELHVDESEGRTRIYDVVSALAGEVDDLRLAPFDLIRLDDQHVEMENYGQVHDRLMEIFGKEPLCAPVPAARLGSRHELVELYEKWVTKEGAEGLVVRSELPMIFKIKPQHPIDAVILGYNENDEGEGIKDLLLGLGRPDGTLQVVGRVGNGFDDALCKSLLKKLSGTHSESEYIATDSRNIAFRMVEPVHVVEVKVNDLLTETKRGTIRNPVLSHGEAGYRMLSMMPGVSLIHPIYMRSREDKDASPENIRFEQISKIVLIEDVEESAEKSADQAKSEVILREVYTKESKGALTVQKFLTWKTNKDGQDPRFPAYVFNYTNYSPGRAAPLKRDVRISQSEKQIRLIAAAFIEKNIKKGWHLANDAMGGSEAKKPVEKAAKKNTKETGVAKTKPAKKAAKKKSTKVATEAKPAKKKAAKKSAKKKATKKK